MLEIGFAGFVGYFHAPFFAGTKLPIDVLEKLTGIDRGLTPSRFVVWQVLTLDVGGWI
ncbi:hypothetical protein [Bradyrhizobium sp. S3.9.1]|uniref:hypothetical protein n=1 Tax=Bradyrhizobium sp. S3.9.1 TaxID=3156431 RepID=UPI003394ED6A